MPPYLRQVAVLLICMYTSTGLDAQEISRSVIGSAGSHYQQASVGSLHWTVGEVAVSTLDNGIQLAEGFHQGYYELIVSAPEVDWVDWSVGVFPNPVADRLVIETNEPQFGIAILYDQLGRPVSQLQLTDRQTTIDVSILPAGTYWLRLRSSLGRERTFQVQKIRR